MADSQPDTQVFNQTQLSVPLHASLCGKLAHIIESKENCSFHFIEVVYVDEDEIVRINRKHLDRDYITDIITFRYDETDSDSNIEGTLFCCAPRIVEQAAAFGVSPDREYLRIYIHGLLHLVGYDDQTEEEKKLMTNKENAYLDQVDELMR